MYQYVCLASETKEISGVIAIMAIRIEEDRESYASAGFQWDKITHSLEPEIQPLTDPKDRAYYTSKIKFLIGKEIRLSNIPSQFLYGYLLRNDWIISLTKYPYVLTQEYVRSEIEKMLFRLGIRISEDGLGWKYGPMGFQQSKVTQELIQPKGGH